MSLTLGIGAVGAPAPSADEPLEPTNLANTQAIMKALILTLYDMDMGDLLEDYLSQQYVVRTDGDGYLNVPGILGPSNPPQMTAWEFANSLPGVGINNGPLVPGA